MSTNGGKFWRYIARGVSMFQQELIGVKRRMPFHELDHMLASIPSGEKYVVLGDWNAYVWSRQHMGDQWAAVRRPHGYGVTNDAGNELLSITVNQVTVSNTGFRKKAIYQRNWQHPKSKQWSCIDYVLRCQKGRKICLDVTVKERAERNTDHQFACARIRMAGCGYRRKASGNRKEDMMCQSW